MGKFAGRDRLRKVLKSLPTEQRRAIRAAILEGAATIVETQKNLVPVLTGALKASIQATPGDEDLPSYATLKSKQTTKDPELSAIITAGSAGTREEGGVRYAHLVEFGTARMHAEPFFYPGFRAQRTAVKRKINAAARKGIKEGLK